VKSHWLSASLFFCLLVGCSQKDEPAKFVTLKDTTPVLLPVKVGGKWGYVNGSGQLVINPQFDNAQEFQEGRAAVCIGATCNKSIWGPEDGALWGFIDTSGHMVVTPQYPEVSGYYEGVASVCTGECKFQGGTKPTSRGYIDRDGKVVIPMQFGTAGSFNEGLAVVCVGNCQYDQNTGYSGRFGFIDHSGRFVINPQYDDADTFKNGFAQVTLGKGNEAKHGYIDKTGKVIWQPSN
jgi:hypothetical protein